MKDLFKVILFATFLLFLNGCATTSTKEQLEVIVDNKTHKEYAFPEDKLMTTCPELSKPKGNSKADILSWIEELGSSYSDCSKHKDELANWITRFKNEIQNK